jgi:hypothetical protein
LSEPELCIGIPRLPADATIGGPIKNLGTATARRALRTASGKNRSNDPDLNGATVSVRPLAIQ